MNFLNIFEDRVASIFGAAQAPFSFKKLAKQAAREMEDQTLVINGVDTAPALYTVLISADDDPLLAPHYAQLDVYKRQPMSSLPRRARSSRTCSCSGPILSMGLITPPSTW